MRLGAIAAGIKYSGRPDLMLCEFRQGTTVAGVLTRSGTAGPAVLWCRECLLGDHARALVVNSGNANVFTGSTGERHVNQIAEKVATVAGCRANEVFVASTGVIGEPLPVERIVEKIEPLLSSIADDGWAAASEAIMTTDTFPKVASRTARIGDIDITLNGMAKGSGMIEPNMATMLSFIATDARIPASMLQSILVESNAISFNAITVDSDTSTSDTCLLFATGAVNSILPSSSSDPVLDDFRQALDALMVDLAIQVVRDGEGASKLIEIRITGAASDDAARSVGKCIANSPLVKTAIAGEDANWGRVVMAIGKSGERYEPDALSISFGGVRITEFAQRREDYSEDEVTAHLKGQHILIEVDLGVSGYEATVYTCDLTHGYIDINADYRS